MRGFIAGLTGIVVAAGIAAAPFSAKAVTLADTGSSITVGGLTVTVDGCGFTGGSCSSFNLVAGTGSTWSIVPTGNVLTSDVALVGAARPDLNFSLEVTSATTIGSLFTTLEGTSTAVGQASIGVVVTSNNNGNFAQEPSLDLYGNPNGTWTLPANVADTDLEVTGDFILTGPASVTAIDQGIPAAVPEPASLALLGCGLAGLAMSRRRRSA